MLWLEQGFIEVNSIPRKEQILVKANGQPTRARIREEHTVFCRIDGSHRFMRLKSPQDQVQYEQYITYVRNALKTLSPATRRVLDAVRAALLVSYDEKRGYKFNGYVNRAAIAAQLGRQTLVPYDIKMLRGLAGKRLIQEYTHPLPRKQYGDIWLGAGAEYVYHITSDVLYCLLMVDAQESGRLTALTNIDTSSKPIGERWQTSQDHPPITTSASSLTRRKSHLGSLLDFVSDQNLKRLFGRR